MNQSLGLLTARKNRVDFQGKLGDVCGVVLPTDVCTKHIVHSQLNGNNGEWTNTDDLDNALKQLEGVNLDLSFGDFPPLSKTQNQGRVSKAHHHQKKVNGGRNDPDDQTRRVNSQNAARRVNTKEVKPKNTTEIDAGKRERPVQKLIMMPKPLTDSTGVTRHVCGWDGKQAYKDHNGERCIGLSDGAMAISCHEDASFNLVKRHGTGWIERYTVPNESDDLNQLVYLSSAWDVMWVRGNFVHEGLSFTERSYVVFTPALQLLKTKFSSRQITESLVNGFTAALTREFSLGEYDPLLLQTVQYYVHSSHKLNYELSRTNVCKTKVVVKDRVEEKYLSVLKIQRTNDEIVRFNSVDCEVVDAYPGRTDCLITLKVKGEEEPKYWTGRNGSCYQEGDQSSYPAFKTQEKDANDFKYYRSQFCSFDGDGVKPFVTYSVNARNACKALKRMAGARETQEYDHYLTSLQYAAFGEVISRLFGADNFFQENVMFFDVGRLTCEIRQNHFTKFKVGPQKWDIIEVDGECVGRDTYVTPYGVRCLSHYTQPFVDTGIPAQRQKMLTLYRSPSAWELLSTEGLGALTTSVIVEPHLRSWVNVHDDLPRYKGTVEEMNMIHQQMAKGFQQLLDHHCFEKIEDYKNTHPDWIYLAGWERFLTMMDCESDRKWHAAIAHVKKAIRAMYVDEQLVHTPTEIMVKTVNAKVKKEFAKFGKVPRLFVTYEAGCMFANELPEYSKVCLDGNYWNVVNGVKTNVCIFAKPGGAKLKHVLSEAIASMGRRNYLNVLIYSDDSVWSGNINGVDFAFNVDISSCDSGNKAGVFGLVYTLLSKFRKDLALGLVSQCAKIINLQNPENKEELMQVEMATYFEGSGTVLTTILNHVAMYMVGQAAAVLFGMRSSLVRDWRDVESLIKECGVCFGHVLTVEPCISGSVFVPEKIQFLKRSPLLTTKGEYVPCMNYGPLFRSFGSVEGDLLAEMVGLDAGSFSQMGWDERWDLFASRVVAGLVNEPSSVVLQAMRQRFPRTPKNFDSWSEVTFGREKLQFGGFEAGGFDGSQETIDPMSLAIRYDINVADLEELAAQIGASKFGDVYPSEAVSQFFHIDYGMGKY